MRKSNDTTTVLGKGSGGVCKKQRKSSQCSVHDEIQEGLDNCILWETEGSKYDTTERLHPQLLLQQNNNMLRLADDTLSLFLATIFDHCPFSRTYIPSMRYMVMNNCAHAGKHMSIIFIRLNIIDMVIASLWLVIKVIGLNECEMINEKGENMYVDDIENFLQLLQGYTSKSTQERVCTYERALFRISDYNMWRYYKTV